MLTSFVLVIIVYLCINVQSRQIGFGYYNLGYWNKNNWQQLQTTAPSGTTTTTATPAFRRCVSDCLSRVTKQYDPICASNGQSFDNVRSFRCARSCGLRARSVERLLRILEWRVPIGFFVFQLPYETFLHTIGQRRYVLSFVHQTTSVTQVGCTNST
ncbi:uncharacterized protein LOC116167586 [Photinus pyralis]|uniref:uncharacterized protein LOC116167586 n=1 Tax=Photinus pyralis TaxID=7054 RepID=UPI00126731D9|nr:uncharacterized protein LOC116167586 [Photinus pyralis]